MAVDSSSAWVCNLMTDILDKLRALDKAASPGPWGAQGTDTIAVLCGDPHGDPSEPLTTVLAFSEAAGCADANAQYTALARTLLLPTMEALERCIRHENGHRCDSKECSLCTARAVFAQLEEALK